MLRMTLLAGAAIGGLALSVAYPSIPETARSLLGMQSTATGAARAAAPAAAPRGTATATPRARNTARKAASK